MLVAILADTHLRGGVEGELGERVLELIARADALIHAGDFSSAPALADFERLAGRLVAVHGNVEEQEVVERLPAEVTVELGGVKVGVVHDAGSARGRYERLERRFDADAVVFGHSHMPLLEGRDGFQIFNPGSPTQRRRAPARTLGLARIDAGEIRFEHVTLS